MEKISYREQQIRIPINCSLSESLNESYLKPKQVVNYIEFDENEFDEYVCDEKSIKRELFDFNFSNQLIQQKRGRPQEPHEHQPFKLGLEDNRARDDGWSCSHLYVNELRVDFARPLPEKLQQEVERKKTKKIISALEMKALYSQEIAKRQFKHKV